MSVSICSSCLNPSVDELETPPSDDLETPPSGGRPKYNMR